MTEANQRFCSPSNAEAQTGITVKNEWTTAVDRAGGTSNTYPAASVALHKEILGHSRTEVDRALLEAHGGPGDHQDALPLMGQHLPEPAQRAMMAGHVISAFDLNATEFQGTPEERHEQVIESVKESGRTVRRSLPW